MSMLCKVKRIRQRPSYLAQRQPMALVLHYGPVYGISKSMVGLANDDNTADASKPISSLTQDALDNKAPLASPTFSGTVQGITKSIVGLGNVDNTSDKDKPLADTTLAMFETLSGSFDLRINKKKSRQIRANIFWHRKWHHQSNGWAR